ncbi:MAG: DUF5689 domain-containing protein [Bacteroidetes bacterium]|nr:DUF5689 domain-containing protein [Bacteroidota bacterium]
MKYLSVKKSGIILTMGLLAFVIAALTGCVKKDFDEPPVIIPYVNFPANATMDTLVKLYGVHTDTVRINDSIVIMGIVAGNDQSGNIYKKLYIQDSTGGIDFEIDQADLYTQFKIGQRVYIKCQGLYLGLYGGALELGYIYNGGIGRMPSSMIKSHIYLDSLPGKPPVPETFDVTAPAPKLFSKLIAVPEVRFPDAGSPFVTGGVTTSRPIGDIDGTTIQINGYDFILYTSNYASFANNLLPQGVGTVQGILTVFNGKYELLVRDLNDMVAFADTGQTVIYKNNFDADPGSEWPIFSVTGNKPWTWSSTYASMAANGYGGSGACETWLMSPALDLTNITNPILTFKTWAKYSDSGQPTPMEVKISTDYSGSGDPTPATWSDVQCTLSPAGSGAWTSSGDISLSAYHQKVYIAFRYRSSGAAASSSTSWEMDTFKLTGKKN